MDIKKFPNPAAAARQLGKDLTARLSEAKKSGLSLLLLFSGGSAFSILDHLDKNSLGDYLTISVLDERYDPTNQNNNFVNLTKTDFYRRAKKELCNFIDISVKRGQTQKQLANYFEKELKKWLFQNKNGRILATLGMGIDGHIAGIMPHPKNPRLFKKLFLGKKLVASYDAKNKNQQRFRITATITFLKSINEIFAFICGNEKKEAFKKALKPEKIFKMPAQTMNSIKNLTIYTDIL